jgi:hypothetical protein
MIILDPCPTLKLSQVKKCSTFFEAGAEHNRVAKFANLFYGDVSCTVKAGNFDRRIGIIYLDFNFSFLCQNLDIDRFLTDFE